MNPSSNTMPAVGSMQWRPFGYAGLAGAVAGSLLAGVLLPFNVLMTAAGTGLVLVGASLLIGHTLNQPFLSLAALLVVAVALPFETTMGGTVVGLSVPLAGVVCTVGFIRWAMPPRPCRLESTSAVLATLSLMGVAVVAFVAGQFPWFPTEPAPIDAQLGGLALFLLSGGLFLVTGHEVRSARQLERLTWIFIASGGVVVILMVVTPIGPLGGIVGTQSIGSAFWTWFVAVTAGQGLFNRSLSTATRCVLLALTGLALARGMVLAFDWISGWLPPLVAAGTVLVLRFPRTMMGIALLTVAPLLMLGEPLVSLAMTEESYSLMTRLHAAEIVGEIIARNPWLGFGPANYYYYTPLFPILGWYVNFNTHNNYIDLVAQVGLVGLAAFGWFVVAVGRMAARLRPLVTSEFAAGYLAGALGGLAGSLVAGALADWLIPFVYNVGLQGFRSSLLFWVVLGGVLALKRIEQTAVSRELAG